MLTSYSARITRRCALGRVELACEVNGADETVASAVGKVLEDMKCGDTLAIAVTRNVPTGHPLDGIALYRTAEEEDRA